MSRSEVIERDGYDRDVFDRALAGDAQLQRCCERVGRLLPAPEAFVSDLFCVLFKMNVVLRHASDVPASGLLSRRLIESVVASPGLSELKRSTELNAEGTTQVVPVLAERIIKALTRDNRVVVDELLSAAEMAAAEEEVEALKEQIDIIPELPPEALGDRADELKDMLRREQADAERDIESKRQAVKKLVDDLPVAMDNEIAGTVKRLPEQVEGLESQMNALGIGAGAAGTMSARDRLDLGEKLLASKKLQRLARLTGAFKEVAFEARKKRIARSPQETHEVEAGDDLSRLLPSEVAGLGLNKSRWLRLDFKRRYIEKNLLQYKLHGPASRGPMVVCVDGSGSMQGSKELWAKAVALTLMEIARRERRRCLAIVFSGGDEVFEVELLSTTRARKTVDRASVLKFAEFFPGGGTNFEAPLRRALAAVSEGDYRRGDIVFITDGQAHVSDTMIEEIEAERKKHRFAIRAIEVDVKEGSTRDVLDRFADDVRRISDLTADSLADLFAEV